MKKSKERFIKKMFEQSKTYELLEIVSMYKNLIEEFLDNKLSIYEFREKFKEIKKMEIKY